MSKSFDNFIPNCYTNNEKYFLNILKSTKNRGGKKYAKIKQNPTLFEHLFGGGGA